MGNDAESAAACSFTLNQVCSEALVCALATLASGLADSVLIGFRSDQR
jgi:hypothetical protein